MKQTLKIKTPLYMGNGTWLEEDFTETHSASPIVEVGMKGFGSAVSLNNTLLFSLLCAAAFGLFQDDLRTVRYHYTVTSELKNEFQKLYSDPSQFKGVKFSATNDEMGKCVEIIMRENHLENKLTEGFG